MPHMASHSITKMNYCLFITGIGADPARRQARKRRGARAPHLLLSQESRAASTFMAKCSRRPNLCGTRGSTSWQKGRSHACRCLKLRDNVHGDRPLQQTTSGPARVQVGRGRASTLRATKKTQGAWSSGRWTVATLPNGPTVKCRSTPRARSRRRALCAARPRRPWRPAPRPRRPRSSPAPPRAP